MDIDQHLFFVRSSFLLSNLRCDKFRKSYSGLKYFLALIFSFFAAFSQFSSLYILRYSHKLPIGLLCMEIVLYRCQLAIELRNGVFIWILGHFLRATLRNHQIFIYKCLGALLVLKKDISKPSKARGRSTTFVICII